MSLLPPPTGMVWLVGAGPGSADLLTIRAHRLITSAETIVHDRLVSAEILALAPPTAELIDVGKSRANHCLPQDDINALLIARARAGQRVIRLKGGDPLVFGRGGEEIAALADAGIPHEIVPGITAALACAAQFSIPLTHRGLARSLTLATGHTMHGADGIDIASLAGNQGTSAIYMGTTLLPHLARELIAAGVHPQTPAALIHNGGSPHAHMHRADLATLPSAPARPGPGLVLIGEAVAQARQRAKVSQ
jgi:uroporphyrin-III C-methyltransferase/precorrin-2 dehydrogenase/sirohydrochlorin ferrochelatase